VHLTDPHQKNSLSLSLDERPNLLTLRAKKKGLFVGQKARTGVYRTRSGWPTMGSNTVKSLFVFFAIYG
jgi:hypothetical protein